MRTLAQEERRFAFALLAPALLILVLTTTAPLVYLLWTSLQRVDLSMPWLSGFAGLDNFARMGGDPRFWGSLWLTLIYTGTTVVLQVAIGLALVMIHLVSIPVTNTSVNPARSTGPAVIVGGWALSQLWLFWLAPLLGAVCAGLGYRLIAGGETQTVAGGGVREVTIEQVTVGIEPFREAARR